MKKKFENLTIKDAFMFNAALSNKAIAKEMLEVILDMSIKEVHIITEKSIQYHPDYKGVRLDVLVTEEGTDRRFDVEMQVKNYQNLPRRSRYYHTQMDLDALQRGIDYGKLPDSYVIFICDFDPFGKSLYKYSFDTSCKETNEILSDGRKTIFLNAHGKDPYGISDNLKILLEYIKDPSAKNSPSDSELVNKLRKQVASIKYDREWRMRFMQFQEMLNEAKEEGIKEGREQGREEGRKQGREQGRKEELTKRLAAEERAKKAELEIERLKAILAEKENQ